MLRRMKTSDNDSANQQGCQQCVGIKTTESSRFFTAFLGFSLDSLGFSHPNACFYLMG